MQTRHQDRSAYFEETYMLTLCALALPASAAAADTTLNEINARLERLEAELKQSRIQLQDAESRRMRAASVMRKLPPAGNRRPCGVDSGRAATMRRAEGPRKAAEASARLRSRAFLAILTESF